MRMVREMQVDARAAWAPRRLAAAPAEAFHRGARRRVALGLLIGELIARAASSWTVPASNARLAELASGQPSRSR